MRLLGDEMEYEPNPEEQFIVDGVVEVAMAYQAGAIGLDSVKVQTSPKARYLAARCLTHPSEKKRALMSLLDALIADQKQYETKHGSFTRDDLQMHGVKMATNWEGKRVLVFPLYWMDGNPVYPPITVKPGEERRIIEQRLNQEYQAYRDAKKPRRRE